jgi:ubiquinone/menaquinone biosynthesis C-methylase UbiE
VIAIALDSAALLEERAGRVLACPRCRSRLEAHSGAIRCRNTACGVRGTISDGVVLIGDRAGASYFDDKHQVMQQGNEADGVRCLCYQHQARIVEPYLQPGMVVLDVGCGPALCYARPPDCFLIGLDPSRDSLRSNPALDLRVHGTAAALPLPDDSLDAILCFYSVHHMVGRSVIETRAMVRDALREFARTLRPGGNLFVFDVSPWWPFWLAEQAVWNLARRALDSRLDMYFWSARSLTTLARAVLPHTSFRSVPFATSMLSTFPPVFSLPWLRVPRMLYPFDVNLYHWRV